MAKKAKVGKNVVKSTVSRVSTAEKPRQRASRRSREQGFGSLQAKQNAKTRAELLAQGVIPLNATKTEFNRGFRAMQEQDKARVFKMLVADPRFKKIT